MSENLTAKAIAESARLVQQLAARLGNSGRRVVTVESCTGGGIARAITELPGSSNWFDRGFVTYSNEAKSAMAGVPAALIAKHGAVSLEVAAAMAEGGLHMSDAEYCVSVTGVAGPGGGSDEKPVGMVCFGWASREGVTTVECARFAGDRRAIREQSVGYALQGLVKVAGRDGG